MKKRMKNGFTLVELVVVICIIGVLASILVPSMIGYVRKAKRSSDIATAKDIYNDAANVLAEDSDGADAFNKPFDSNVNVTVYRSAGPESYTIQLVAYCIANANSKWVPVVDVVKPFSDAVSKVEDANITLKHNHPSAGGSLDRWFITRRADDHCKIEVWAGDSSNTPLYRIWPETDEKYK